MKNGIHHAVDIERVVLGACLLEQTAFGRTYGLVDEQTFYHSDHQAVYGCMLEMYRNSIPIDLRTVWERLTEKNIRITAPNVAYFLATLTMDVVNSAHVEYHCHLLKKMWRKRELTKLTRSGFDASDDERKQIRQLSNQLSDILGTDVKKEWKTMDELIFDLIVHQEDIKAGKKTFITSGFGAIDRENGGFSPGQMIVIGARPSVGKSALMGKMAIAMAQAANKVGIISLEMNNTEVAGRLAALDTDIEFWKIYRNLFDDESQHKRFYDVVSKKTVNLPIYVSDKTKVDLNEIKAKAAKLKHEHGLDVLMIDYLQLMDSQPDGNRNYNREQEVSKISRGLKVLFMEMNIPGIVLCQLNRESAGGKGKDRYPKLHHLRESGAIEQDADVVLMLHRDWMVDYKEHTEGDKAGLSTEFEADLLGLKWRNGALFHLSLDFDPQKMKFSEKQYSNISRIPAQMMEEEDPF